VIDDEEPSDDDFPHHTPLQVEWIGGIKGKTFRERKESRGGKKLIKMGE